MHRIARRLTIITLTMAIFAFSFSSLVQGVQGTRAASGLQAGASLFCKPGNGADCRGFL